MGRTHLESARRKYIEHMNVVAHYVGFELRYSAVFCDAAEMRKQQRSDPTPVVPVDDGKGHFGTRVRGTNITADSDNLLVAILVENGHYSDMLLEIKFGEPSQVVIAQGTFVCHESMVHGFSTQAVGMFTQAILVARPNCADSNRGTVAQSFLSRDRHGGLCHECQTDYG